jgi:hypothetical protein
VRIELPTIEIPHNRDAFGIGSPDAKPRPGNSVPGVHVRSQRIIKPEMVSFFEKIYIMISHGMVLCGVQTNRRNSQYTPPWSNVSGTPARANWMNDGVSG